MPRCCQRPCQRPCGLSSAKAQKRNRTMPTPPDAMRAVVARGSGGAEVLQVIERPVPQPGPGEILVEVAAAGVNRPDVLQRKGGYPPPPGAPDTLGLEIAGA